MYLFQSAGKATQGSMGNIGCGVKLASEEASQMQAYTGVSKGDGGAIPILVVDDEPGILEGMARVLVRTQRSRPAADVGEPCFDVLVASTGEQALTLVRSRLQAQQCAPWVAFVDLSLSPGIDGVQTAKGLRELSQEVQLVLCTSSTHYTWEDVLGELGGGDNLLILRKPFESAEIRQMALALSKKYLLAQHHANAIQAAQAIEG